MNTNHFGTLYIVATPIGNLKDISQRAVETLSTVDYIAAEDTRHSKMLSQHFLINTPMLALHEHNERECADKLLVYLQEGKSIAVVSDAGTPLISDPGYYFVREARKAGVTIVPIPGPCALITALCVSGLPTDRFTFEGFLPAKSKSRVDSLTALSQEQRTMVFYEAPHRILACLQDMVQVFGSSRQAVIGRELTKKFETIYTGSLAELVDGVSADSNQERGEIVVIVEGAVKDTLINRDEASRILSILIAELPLKQAVELAAKISGKRKNDLYQQALLLKKED